MALLSKIVDFGFPHTTVPGWNSNPSIDHVFNLFFVNIPSAQLKAGDAVTIREKAKKQLRIQSAIEIASQFGLPEWVDVDTKKMVGVLKSLPDREDILPDINENLVVELYSK